MRAADGRSWRPLADGPFAARETPGREPVKVGIKPECEGCKIGAHGFMCHFADGSCLKTIHEEGGRRIGMGNAGAIAGCQAG